MLRNTVIFVVLLICDVTYAFPDDIERCRMNDEKCLLKSANNVLKKYSKGIKELNLPSIDPLLIDYVKVAQDAGIVTVRGSANDSYVHGMSKGKIVKISGFDRNILEIKFKLPKFSANGNYISKARVIGVPIDGNGKFKITFNDFDATLKFNLSKVERNGKEYFTIVKTKMSFDTSGGDINISDFGYFINSFLNASFNIIKTSLSNIISEAWGEHFQKAVNSLFTEIPIEELFLANE